MFIRVLRLTLKPLLPAKGPLPMRYWRRTWLAALFRLFIGLPVFCVLVIPYVIALGIVWTGDWFGSRCASLYARSYNHDLVHSGWRHPQSRLAAPSLSERWKSGD